MAYSRSLNVVIPCIDERTAPNTYSPDLPGIACVALGTSGGSKLARLTRQRTLHSPLHQEVWGMNWARISPPELQK